MSGETIHVLGKQVELRQLPDGFKTSLDSVILAAACPVDDKASRVLDMGCGVGSALFCILQRVDAATGAGVDIDEDAIRLARENARLNDCGDRAAFHVEDIRSYDVGKDDRFDHVICNPPYMEAGTHLSSPSHRKAQAHGHQQPGLALKDWIKAGFAALKPHGSITFIHRADRLDSMLQIMGRRFGAYEIIPLWPKAGVSAKRVIVRARKDRRSPGHMYPGIVLHEEDGQYTAEANEILRECKKLY